MWGEQIISVLDLLEAFYSSDNPDTRLSTFKDTYNKKTEGHIGSRYSDTPFIEHCLISFFNRTSLPLFFLFHGEARGNSGIKYGKNCFAYPLKDKQAACPDEAFPKEFLSIILWLNIKCESKYFEKKHMDTSVNHFNEQSSFFIAMVHDVESSYSLFPIHINTENCYPQVNNFSAIHVDPSATILPQNHTEKNVEYNGGLYILLDF